MLLLRKIPKCFSASCTVGTGCVLSRPWGWRPLTLTFFLLFPVQEPLPSAELASSRKTPCFPFVLSIPPQTYLFSWELSSFAAVQPVPVCFPSAVFDVLLLWWHCWRSRAALPTLAGALQRRGPKSRLFLLEYFHMC